MINNPFLARFISDISENNSQLHDSLTKSSMQKQEEIKTIFEKSISLLLSFVASIALGFSALFIIMKGNPEWFDFLLTGTIFYLIPAIYLFLQKSNIPAGIFFFATEVLYLISTGMCIQKSGVTGLFPFIILTTLVVFLLKNYHFVAFQSINYILWACAVQIYFHNVWGFTSDYSIIYSNLIVHGMVYLFFSLYQTRFDLKTRFYIVDSLLKITRSGCFILLFALTFPDRFYSLYLFHNIAVFVVFLIFLFRSLKIRDDLIQRDSFFFISLLLIRYYYDYIWQLLDKSLLLIVTGILFLIAGKIISVYYETQNKGNYNESN